MTLVIKYADGKEPDIHFGIAEFVGNQIIRDIEKEYDVSPYNVEDPIGQNPLKSSIHFYNAVKKTIKKGE